jgi:hypothetical protein
MNTLDTQNTPSISETDEVAIRAAANQIIAAAAQKGGYSVSEIPEEAKLDALNYARNAYAEEQAQKSNPVYAQLQAEREAHRLTQLQLQAVSQTRIAPNNDVKPVADVSRVRGLMGERDWHSLTDSGRLAACGISQVTAVERQQCKELFGRGCDSHRASDFFKSDAGEYRRLKNIAIVMGWQGQ